MIKSIGGSKIWFGRGFAWSLIGEKAHIKRAESIGQKNREEKQQTLGVYSSNFPQIAPLASGLQARCNSLELWRKIASSNSAQAVALPSARECVQY
jgi:hypothetical protein